MTQLALVIDLNVCVGCHACVTSCKQWNTSGAAGPLTDDRPYGADPTGTFFNRVQTFEVGEYPNTQAVHFSKSCLHCEDPPCVPVCPTGAGWASVPALNLLMGAPVKVAAGTSGLVLSLVDSAAAWVYINRGAVLPMLSNAEFEMLAPELAIKADALTAARIHALEAIARLLSVTLSPRVRRGANLAAEINAEARSAGTDLLVICRRGQRGFLSRLLVGEMVSQVVAHAPCSVLVTPRAATMWCTLAMVGVDPQAPDAACLAAAAAVAADGQLPLLVVCVAAADPGQQTLAASALATALQQARLLHADVSGEVVTGLAAQALLTTAEQRGADLLVVSRNRPGAGSRSRMGSTTEAVTGRANGPVLVHVGAAG